MLPDGLLRGSLVAYHGSRTNLHGTYLLDGCGCYRCIRYLDLVRPGAVVRWPHRLTLWRPDTMELAVVHVRLLSVTILDLPATS